VSERAGSPVTNRIDLPKPKLAHPAVVAFAVLTPVVIIAVLTVQYREETAGILAAWGILIVLYTGVGTSRARLRFWLEGTSLGVWGWRSRQVDLAAARSLTLRPDGFGGAVLRASGDGGRVYVTLLVLDDTRTCAQPAWACRAIADAVALNPLPVASPIAALLRAQADHLDAGGAEKGSPLTPLTSQALMKAAGTVGAIGAITALLS
jgi:hypothetical protein